MFEKNSFITQLISYVESLFFLYCFVLHFYYNSSSHIKSGKKVSQLRTEEKLIFGSSLLFRLQSSLHKKLPSMATPRPPYFLLDVPETVRQIQCVLRHFVITTHFEIIYAQSYLVTKFKNVFFFLFCLDAFMIKSRLVQFRQDVITNCVDGRLLHVGALITKCVGRIYYKMPQLF